MESGAPRKALLEVLDGRKPWRRPVWFMRQAGRYLSEYRAVRERAGSFLGLCDRPALAAEVTLQPLRRFDLDAAIVFADILLVPRALGLAVEFRESEGPVLGRVSSQEEVKKLDPRNLLERLGPVYEAVGRAKDALEPHQALIGFCGAPWTVASYMIEGGTSLERMAALRAAYAREQWFDALIELLTETAVEHLVGQFKAGADVAQIFDSWAGDLGEGMWERYCLAPVRAVVGELRRRGYGRRVIAFPRGLGPAHVKFAEDCGAAALSVESRLPAAWLAREVAPRIVVQGNLDPVVLALGGEALGQEVERLVGTLPRSRHIFNLGHGVRPDTPPEHVAEAVRLVREFDGGAC